MDKVKSHVFSKDNRYPEKCTACPFTQTNPIHKVVHTQLVRGIARPDVTR